MTTTTKGPESEPVRVQSEPVVVGWLFVGGVVVVVVVVVVVAAVVVCCGCCCCCCCCRC